MQPPSLVVFFTGKIEKFGNLTGVKDLTSSMSDYRITQLNAPSITATDQAPYKASHEVVNLGSRVGPSQGPQPICSWILPKR